MSDVGRQLLITPVHGTWGRGFFPEHQRAGRPPFWFEDGSHFLTRFRAALGDIPHAINPLLWSGANSIFTRDETARALAKRLAAEHAEDPQAMQLVIAHSHGGNIALRALHHLQKLGGSPPNGAPVPSPFVVTLATPFIEIHQADLGRRPSIIRVAAMFALGIVSVALSLALLLLLLVFVLPSLSESAAGTAIFACEAVVAALMVAVGWWWIVGKAATRQHQIDALKDATRLDGLALRQRLLVVRAIDDEASLALAAGTILNFLTSRLITYVFIFALISPLLLYVPSRWAYPASLLGFIVLTGMLVGALVASRSVHGRELATSPMECQINTQSAPDAVDLSQIVTLVSHDHAKSLRHGIYEHENCAKVIADWLRAQLGPSW